MNSLSRCLWSIALILGLSVLSACATTGAIPAAASSTNNLLQIRAAAAAAYSRADAKTARLLYKALSERVPNDAQVWRRLGNLYVLSGENDQALNAYAHAIKLGGANSEVWYNVGVVRVRQAEGALIHAQQSAPPDSGLHKSLAATSQRLHAVFPNDAVSSKLPTTAPHHRSTRHRK